MATLKIRRPVQYADYLRDYILIADGKPIGKIRRGEEIVVDLPPGQHEIWAEISWCRSKSITAKMESDRVYNLEVGSNIQGWRMLIAIIYVTLLTREYLYLREI